MSEERQVIHIVLFNLAPDVPQERIDKVWGMFRACLGPCEGLLSVDCGANNSPSDYAKNWTHGVTMLFESAQARDNYIPHPLHRAISEEVSRDFFDDLVVYDMEVGSRE